MPLLGQIASFVRRAQHTMTDAVGVGGKVNAARCLGAYALTKAGLKPRPREVLLRFPSLDLFVNSARLDIVAYWEIWSEREYAPSAEFETRPNDVVVDVGANIGVHTLYRAQRTPGVKVYAIEPDPATFALLKKNVEQNGANVVCENKAGGDQEGEVWFQSSPLSLNSKVVAPNTPGAFRVPATTVDHLIAEHHIDRIDLMKIDTEGFELPVLRGAERALKITSRLVIEWHNKPDREAIKVFAADRGFQLKNDDRKHALLFFAR